MMPAWEEFLSLRRELEDEHHQVLELRAQLRDEEIAHRKAAVDRDEARHELEKERRHHQDSLRILAEVQDESKRWEDSSQDHAQTKEEREEEIDRLKSELLTTRQEHNRQREAWASQQAALVKRAHAAESRLAQARHDARSAHADDKRERWRKR